MKKMILALMTTLAMVQPALANEVELNAAVNEEQTFDLEEGAMTAEELQKYVAPSVSTFGRKSDAIVGGIIGGVVGGIIGGVAAGDYDNHHRPHRPGHGHGPGYGHGGGYGRPDVMCFAQNRRGEMFRAIGMRPRMVQERAMDKCMSFSRFCRPMGCRPADRY